MNEINEQYDYYVSKCDIDSIEDWDKLKHTMNKNKYILEKPKRVEETELYNPAVKIYQSTNDWDEGWTPVDETAPLKLCPEYVPTPEAIRMLVDIGSITEIGAGNGYWAHVINQNGGDVYPTDMFPVDVDYDDYYDYVEEMKCGDIAVENYTRKSDSYPYINKYQNEEMEEPHYEVSWCKVDPAMHYFAKNTDSEYILLCHPVKSEWTEQLLSIIREYNKKLILVAEWEPGPDATPKFFYELNNKWNLKDTFPIYDWKSMNIGGYIFEPN